MDRLFAPLTEAEVRTIADRIERARGLVFDFDPRPEGDDLSLGSLDRAFENYMATGNPKDADEINRAVGAAFGAALVEGMAFRWVIATDDWGTDLAVLARPGRGDVTIFPAEFVAKRYERREAPFLVEAFAEIGEHLREIAAGWGEQG